MQGPPNPSRFAAGAPSRWAAEVARPGALSIVVQGPVHAGNAAQVEVNVRHWRRLFPHAQIVLAVSTTDLPGLGRWGGPKPLRFPHARPRGDGSGQEAVRALGRLCDRIVLSRPEAPLPPLKYGETAPNHGNLQIAAARAGMARAQGAYALRVRNDLVFADASFLRFYCRYARQPRRQPAGFADRLLISPLFTLNPYALERLPFHFSDFFHFGRTEDVRSVWTGLPRIPAKDSSYYARHPHAADSTEAECRFRTRLAMEQHIHFGLARSRFPGAVLGFHNDRSSAAESVSMLLNDFIVCDMAECAAIFPKWGWLFRSGQMRRLCISAEDWVALNGMNASSDRAAYLGARASPGTGTA